MLTQKYNFKQLAFTSLVFVSVLSSGVAISALAQENIQPTPPDRGDLICQRVKDNLTTKFDLDKEKQEAIPFKLQNFLDKKIEQAKAQGDNIQRIDTVFKDTRERLKESQISYIRLFETFEKIKTADCDDAEAFLELIKQAREIMQGIRMQSIIIVIDTRRQLPLLNSSPKANQENPNNYITPQPRPEDRDQPSKDQNGRPNRNKPAVIN